MTIQMYGPKVRDFDPEPAVRAWHRSGIDLIEKFSLYSDQNQIFECKIQIKQGSIDNNGFHVDIN